MAGRSRHLPRHLHQRLTLAIAQQPCWFTDEAVLAGLGATVQRFRRREVAAFLMHLVRLRLLEVDGTGPRRFRRIPETDWLRCCLHQLTMAERLEASS
jgi:hypothetical protein